jgi:tetratricopeptide (TPR) repeat protein
MARSRFELQWIRARARFALFTALASALPVAAELYHWVDGAGAVHVTDDLAAVPEAQRTQAAEALGEVWGAQITGGGAAVGGESRSDRVVRGAIDDIARGETVRAAAALEAVLRSDARHPEAHWQLAQLDRARGRYESAAEHLRAFLSSAGESFEARREVARRRLAELEVEQRLVADPGASRPESYPQVESSHFRVEYDPGLDQPGGDYAASVLSHLEHARASAEKRLGALPAGKMGVVFYGKAAYLQAHRHRFSFETVGFFDGRIHVVSAAHPERELRDLLFHEFTHAAFRELTGGDRPFWLNEGLAELAERNSRHRDGLTRGERVLLRGRIDAASWIPLRELDAGFSGLDNEAARAAYLESTAAAAWLIAHSSESQRAQLLAGIGRREHTDAALRAASLPITDELDRRVREQILSEFPELPSFGTPAAGAE